MANSKAVIQKWSQSLTRGSRLRTFPSVVITGKILVFWMGVRPWEVVAHGGSTVYFCIREDIMILYYSRI